jgi:hypothetical protein
VIDIPTLFYCPYVVSGATLRKEDDSYNSLYGQSFQYSMGNAVLYEQLNKDQNNFFCKYLTGICMYNAAVSTLPTLSWHEVIYR